ncbi:MAG TPA: hypothetical protein VFD82_08950 [Planctomycetota bacterium]|nr:hypothetical protein [Planctomycetota bacterium]
MCARHVQSNARHIAATMDITSPAPRPTTSTIVSARIVRPRRSVSLTKSIDQRSFGSAVHRNTSDTDGPSVVPTVNVCAGPAWGWVVRMLAS